MEPTSNLWAGSGQAARLEPEPWKQNNSWPKDCGNRLDCEVSSVPKRNISYLIPCRRLRGDKPFPTLLRGSSRCLPNGRVIKEIM